MGSKRFNLTILIAMICYTCPLFASAQETQETTSVSQSSTTQSSNEETTKQKAKSTSKPDSEKKPDPSKKAAKKTATADKQERKTGNVKQNRARQQKQTASRFVDRNGDGIHDGMEYRFRRKHQQARSGKNTDSHGRHVRQQRRRGAEGSPGKGMQHGVQ